jgi:auxin response factor
VGAGETSARAAGSFEDSAQLSRVTKDHTHMVNGSPREIQSHQSCSGRSRIKVTSFKFLSFYLSCRVTCVFDLC